MGHPNEVYPRTDINYAYVECNEKIDDAMNGLPRDHDRPRVVKASATDIPVFNLMISLKEENPDPSRFLETSDLVKSVYTERIEHCLRWLWLTFLGQWIGMVIRRIMTR